MRIIVGLFVWCAVVLSSGCAIWEKETTNRGGFLDYLADEHWLKADSKSMRALRAFAIQVSLARIASVSAKNESDRQLLAIRIGATTKRFLPVMHCAFEKNPLNVAGAEKDPCFYYDSAMVDYSTALFDLAMVALPREDAKKLMDAVTGAVINPVNVVEVLEALVSIGRFALKYGRIVGALYRDTIELEVQLWLATPEIDARPAGYRVTDAHVAALREIYDRKTDDMPAWIAAISVLRGQGLEPMPHPKFFNELGGLMKYLCDLITTEPKALAACKEGLPTTLQAPTRVLAPITTIVTVTPQTARQQIGPRDRPPVSNSNPAFAKIFEPYSATVHNNTYVGKIQHALCVPPGERGQVGVATTTLIRIYEMAERRPKTGKLGPGDIDNILGQGLCPDNGAKNYFERRTYKTPDDIKELVTFLNKSPAGGTLPPETVTLQAARRKIEEVRKALANDARLEKLPPTLADQVTPELPGILRSLP